MRTPKMKHKMSQSRQRAINYIIHALMTKNAHTAAWNINTPYGKIKDADFYRMEAAQ